jgi:hypothetical protein
MPLVEPITIASKFGMAVVRLVVKYMEDDKNFKPILCQKATYTLPIDYFPDFELDGIVTCYNTPNGCTIIIYPPANYWNGSDVLPDQYMDIEKLKTDSSFIASLIHDMFYKNIKAISKVTKLSEFVIRKKADIIYGSIVGGRFGKLTYFFLRVFGWLTLGVLLMWIGGCLESIDVNKPDQLQVEQNQKIQGN